MFKGFGQLASLMKNAQGLPEKLAESKERIAKLKCEGEAGGGMVSVTISGAMRIVNCKVDPVLFQSGDKEMLEELIVAATNQALEKLIEQQAQEMGSITGGMDLSGLSDMLGGLGIGKPS